MAWAGAGWRQNRELTGPPGPNWNSKPVPTLLRPAAELCAHQNWPAARDGALYQTRQAFSCTSGLPLAQPNARANSGMLAMVLFTRYLGSECGLVRTTVRMISGRSSSHQLLAKERKKR